MRITIKRADSYLAADLVPTEAAITSAIKRSMKAGQGDAFASLAFNIGGPGFAHSTVVKRFNAGDVVATADAFLLWCKPAALKGRRQAERAQFLKPPCRACRPGPAHWPRRPSGTLSRNLFLPPPPVAAQPVKGPTMPALAAFLLTLFGVSAAQAASVDFAPVVDAGISYFAVPLIAAGGAWLSSHLITAAKNRKYLDQKTAALLAQNVDGVLQKAISYGSSQALSFVGARTCTPTSKAGSRPTRPYTPTATRLS